MGRVRAALALVEGAAVGYMQRRRMGRVFDAGLRVSAAAGPQ
jgi:hypothetical protein